ELTYGVIVYQEQVMQIVQIIGGFSLGGAEVVRLAMGKKVPEKMKNLNTDFADGAENQGITLIHIVPCRRDGTYESLHMT
uniref:hypothetical protein n=1 Tax=Campylobacter jejuni TaxID=197 RepID=UPI00131A2DDC